MLMQKVEVFEQAINSTTGDDLAKVLWLKSPSSEVKAIRVMSDLLFTCFFFFFVPSPRCGLTGEQISPARWQSCPWLDTSWGWETGEITNIIVPNYL